jgi:bacterioferritin
MASKRLMGLLNRAIAREIQVSIQYMWQNVLWKGIEGFAFKEELRTIALTEMRHAEQIAMRLAYFGGRPTTEPDPISVGKTFKQMVREDVKAEQGAVKLYKEIIALAEKEKDYTTVTMFKTILAEEEDHLDTFQALLGK